MERAWTPALQLLPVRSRAVAFVLGEPVTGEARVAARHPPVAHDLRDDRRSRDRQAQGVPIDQTELRERALRESHVIEKKRVGLDR
jgi:hypothetical protein